MVEIVQYDPKWNEKFLKIKNNLSVTFKNKFLIIEHVGSTSVVGLGSKPIIDIMLGVENLKDADEMIPEMINLGYEYISKYEDIMPERRYFKKKGEHIHTVVYESEFWKRLLLFRDYLRINNKAKADYYKLKKDLSEIVWEPPNNYTDAKTEFIRSIEKEAAIYFSENE